jgi:ketoreductase RED2
VAERVVLVTGSTSGIGEATALRFAKDGDHVVFNSVRSVEAGERLAGATPNSIYVQGDVAKSEDCTRLVAAVLEHYGRLDVLINNAGTTKVIPHADLQAASLDVWREIFEVNVFGTWSLCVAAMIPYAASKAAVNHMTALLAKVVGPEVRVNAVAPGLIDTPWTEDWETVRGYVRAVAPLKRSGTPEDVADVIVALASSAYVTGQVVVVDGGLGLAT